MQERLEAIVSGRVQLVMYRDFTQRTARRLGLTGFVKNLRGGTVSVVAEGPRDRLNALMERLHQGPFFARVDGVQAAWGPATGEFSSFVIAYE